MKKAKLLTLVVITLLLINIVTLGFLIISASLGRQPLEQSQGGKSKPRKIIIEKLHLDANQQKEYDKLIKWHRGEIRTIEDNISTTKNELYQLLSESKINLKTKDSLINSLTLLQKRVEITHFKHFEDIKKLCHEEQLKKFNHLTKELGRIFSKGHKPPRLNHD